MPLAASFDGNTRIRAGNGCGWIPRMTEGWLPLRRYAAYPSLSGRSYCGILFDHRYFSGLFAVSLWCVQETNAQWPRGLGLGQSRSTAKLCGQLDGYPLLVIVVVKKLQVLTTELAFIRLLGSVTQCLCLRDKAMIMLTHVNSWSGRRARRYLRNLSDLLIYRK